MAEDDNIFDGSDDNLENGGSASNQEPGEVDMARNSVGFLQDAKYIGPDAFGDDRYLIPPSPEGAKEGKKGTQIIRRPIEKEMSESYLTYSLSVIISRAIPDVRDGLKPSQRRILVAMNDLGIGPGSQRVKCAKISGDASGNYHPHGEAIIYPTLVRMAQDWNIRNVLVDKQGNFGSIAGLPPAAMRYTEARLSGFAMAMLEDLKLDSVDFVPTYDGTRTEPVVLPSKVPNLLVNGANGIAVGMATSIPPHNLGEICDAAVACIDNPDITIQELMHICPGPDFPTGGVICGARGIRRGYMTGRGGIVLRARTIIEPAAKGKRARIIVTEIPYQQTRDRIAEKIAEMVNEGRVVGVSEIRDESNLEEPVRLVLELKKDADPNLVLNQLYNYTPLQSSFSIILLALVDGRPRVMTFKELIVEYLRHRRSVIRRRTNFLLNKAIRRQHTVEGLLIAHANIDEVIRTIRTSPDQATAKINLMKIQCPAALLERVLGKGFESVVANRGLRENYTLTPVQADAILRMTLGQLVNLEQAKLANEYNELIDEIDGYRFILSDERNILGIVRQDLLDVKEKFGKRRDAKGKNVPDGRRTEIIQEELYGIDDEDLIEEETMVVSITTNGYIKRTPLDEYKAQKRGGKGVKGAKVAEEDPVRHLFVSSTHNYLMFFTNKGRAYWQKVYGIPASARDGKGRNLVNLLSLEPDEKIANCLAIRDFEQENAYLVMATRDGLIKKTKLSAYGRPRKKGLIAIKLRGEIDPDATPEEIAAAQQELAEQTAGEERLTPKDALVAVDVCYEGDEIFLSTAKGRTIRFREGDVRASGRNSSGVKGITLRSADDCVVGMAIADEKSDLLAVSENGFGKRTPIGPNAPLTETGAEEETAPETTDENVDESVVPAKPYPTKKRGGMGVLDLKTTKRNGAVLDVLRVGDGDEVIAITANGMVVRFSVDDVRQTNRNTQGVRLMNVNDGDAIVAVNRIPRDEIESKDAAVGASVIDVPVVADSSDSADAENADASSEADAASDGDQE